MASIFNATLSLAYGGGARIKWRRDSRSAPASYAGSREKLGQEEEDKEDGAGAKVEDEKKRKKKEKKERHKYWHK